MVELRFTSSQLLARLHALQPRCRVAFALACSLRTAHGLSTPPLAEEALRISDDYVSGRPVDLAAVEQTLSKLEHLPELDRDDLAASYYTLLSLARSDAQSAFSAAQRAYDARDAEAQASMNFLEYTAQVEAQILQQECVQHELRCQADDLEQLEGGLPGIAAVMARARGAA